MEIKIERAVCTDCDNYIFEFDHALKGANGEIRCKNCHDKWQEEDWVAAMEWAQTAEITTGGRLAKKYVGAPTIIYPRGRETA